MRILALGGVGAVASEATRDLAEYSHFDEIIIGDYALDNAQALVREIGDPRLKVIRVDADDEENLRRAIADVDLVMNGLPFKYDYVVNRLCVEEGVPGVDISSDDDQFQLSPIAEEKGMLFIPGCGATPGITNVMARQGIKQMDRVDEIHIYFAAFRCLAPAPGLLTTTFYEFMPVRPDRCYYENGEYIETPSMSGAKTVRFHDQIGEQTVVFVPHDETWTMSESVPGINRVDVRGCFPPQVMSLVRGMLDTGLFSEEEIELEDKKTTPLKVMKDLLLQLPQTRQNQVWAYGLNVEVIGERAGRGIKCTYTNDHPPQEEWGGPGAYYKNVGIPLSIAAQMLVKGACEGIGVLPPETAIPAQPFFDELARRGIKISERIEEYGPVA
jgi:saccharopine dehydrogenase-like NADP-dependent oxidoreductase